jgi:DNA-binding transcriptional LysR family regulator
MYEADERLVELLPHLRGVRTLCAAADSGSFTAAARALGVTQSAVSQQIAALERHLGSALVVRGTQPLELTPEGQTLVRHGVAMLARLEAAEQELLELAGRRAGRLRLGSFPTALTTFVPRAVTRLRRTHPAVAVTIVDDHMQRLVVQLRDARIDLALVYDDEASPLALGPEARTVHLFDDPFRLLLPQGHPATHLAGLTLRQLARERWVAGSAESTWFRMTRNACRTAGFDPAVALASDDYMAVQAFVAAGLGIALVPGLAATHPLPGVQVRRLDSGAPARRIWAAHLYGAYAPAAVSAMTEVLTLVTRPRGRR